MIKKEPTIKMCVKLTILFVGFILLSSCTATKQSIHYAKPSVTDPCPKPVPGYEVEKSDAKSVETIKDAAQNGVASYQATLGEMLLHGMSIERDQEEASYWLNCASQAGNADAALNLALQLYNGDGIEQDYGRAVELARQSALTGSPLGQQLLGNMYTLGQGVPKDMDEAIKWHTKAAEQGNVAVQAGLGYRFLTGDGGPVDLDKALKWLRLAADAGDENSQHNLDVLLEMQQEEKMASQVSVNEENDADDPKIVPEAITILPHWKVGDKVDYVFEKISKALGKEQRTVDFTAVIEVLESNSDSYLVEIRMPTIPLPDGVRSTPEIEKLLKTDLFQGQGLRFEVLIDTYGNILELQNWKEVRDTSFQFMHQLSDALGVPFTEEAQKALAKLYADEPRTQQIVLRDLSIFLRPHGIEFIPGEPLVSESQAETAVSGVLEIKETFLLKDNGEKSNTFHVTCDRAYQYPQEQNNQFSVNESALYTIDSPSGWMNSGKIIREGRNANGELVEAIILQVARK